MNNKQNTIKNKILEEISSKEIKMKPKVYFVLQTVLVVFGIILSISFILYLLSFIIFIGRINGVLLVPSFGIPGIGMLFFSLPWLLIVVVLLLVAILELLARHFSFVYRKPLLYSVLGIIFFSAVVGGAIASTSFHTTNRLPLGNEVHRQYSQLPKDAAINVIQEINENGFILDNQVEVATTSKTRGTKNDVFVVGDRVIIIGEEIDGKIEALGIRKVNENQETFRYGPPRGPKN